MIAIYSDVITPINIRSSSFTRTYDDKRSIRNGFLSDGIRYYFGNVIKVVTNRKIELNIKYGCDLYICGLL